MSRTNLGKASSRLILHYFPGKGRAETARLICAAANIDFVDNRITNWPDIKPLFPFGELPVLEVDGVKVAQSCAIARYLARLGDLAGSDPLEEFRIDALAETITEVREKAVPCMFEANKETKKENIAKFQEEASAIFSKLESRMQGEFLVGNKLSWADIHLYAVVDFIPSVYPRGLAEYPRLQTLTQNVTKVPGVAAYLKTRPQTMF